MQVFDGLVLQYGTVIAHQIWDKAAARYSRPKVKGRPKGSRTRDHQFDLSDAHRIVQAIANDPGNAGLSRWQVLNRAAAVLDANQQQELSNKITAKHPLHQTDTTTGHVLPDLKLQVSSFEQWEISLPKLSPTQRKARQKRISAIQRQLERLQASIDQERAIALQSYDQSIAAIEKDEVLSPRTKSLFQQRRSNILAASPPLPQTGDSSRGKRKKRSAENF